MESFQFNTVNYLVDSSVNATEAQSRPRLTGHLSQIAVSSQDDTIKKLIGVLSLLDPM